MGTEFGVSFYEKNIIGQECFVVRAVGNAEAIAHLTQLCSHIGL